MLNLIKKTVLSTATLMGLLTFTNSAMAEDPLSVYRYSHADASIFENGYLIETKNGVVAIDSALLVTGAKGLRAKLDSLKKPLLAVLITHGHPDHYNGVTELVKGYQVPIIATRSVNEILRRDDAAKAKQWGPMFGAEWPAKRTFPNKIVASRFKTTIDGVDFQVFDLGPGESHADSYWIASYRGQKLAFIGDVVFNRVHPYLGDGHTQKWLKNIDKLQKQLKDAAVIYPGHGSAGSLEILSWQKRYIEKYHQVVKNLLKGKKSSKLSDVDKKSLYLEMKKFLPNSDLDFLIQMGADTVANELK